MHFCEGKLKLWSYNTSYCLIDTCMVTNAGLTGIEKFTSSI